MEVLRAPCGSQPSWSPTLPQDDPLVLTHQYRDGGEAKTMTVREGRTTRRTMPRVKKYKSRGFSLSEAGTGTLTAGVLAL